MSQMSVLVDALATLPAKQAAERLEVLALSDIRAALTQSGLLYNPQQLGLIVEASLGLVGDEEYSLILSALEAEEIAVVVAASTEVFQMQGGTLVVVPEGALAYFSAIWNSGNSEDWKHRALQEGLGFDLLATLARYEEEVYWKCRRFFADAADEIVRRGYLPTTPIDATDAHQAVLDRLERQLAEAKRPLPRQQLASLVDDLRNLGIEEPTIRELDVAIEVAAGVQKVLVAGPH